MEISSFSMRANNLCLEISYSIACGAALLPLPFSYTKILFFILGFIFWVLWFLNVRFVWLFNCGWKLIQSCTSGWVCLQSLSACLVVSTRPIWIVLFCLVLHIERSLYFVFGNSFTSTSFLFDCRVCKNLLLCKINVYEEIVWINWLMWLI